MIMSGTGGLWINIDDIAGNRNWFAGGGEAEVRAEVVAVRCVDEDATAY